ncbi:UDP-N-acetylmuramoyl-tripeptide--D-alanyl-D-alanine ligase [Candidatus Falkowbacteria bacterium]|nr:UDP-N-acetylmuramoyl-tripeptide--D-alanyl-D-alanine ligase [Candidatus Falkowbacteria bacterium]
MKLFLQKLLKISAKSILKKYHPEIIGITGSAGKTGAREAIYAVLSAKLKVRRNLKNYNNEIGVPLTVIGAASPAKSIFGWIGVFSAALKLLLKKDKNYPKILILEMAADKPGDMDYLTEMVKPNIGVITSIGDSHIENFGSLEKIKQEKSVLIRIIDENGRAVLNVDDRQVKSLIKETKAKVLTYAIDSEAEISGKEMKLLFALSLEGKDKLGINFKLLNNHAFIPVFLPNVISKAGVYAALAGAALGVIKGMNLVEISRAFKKYSPPNGRMKLLLGVKDTYIIDDTYNASPAASILAVETLAGIAKQSRENKYAVFGDMLELGEFSQKKHEEVGRVIAKNKIDKLIVAGERSRDIARGAIKAGMKEDNIFHFASAEEAGKFIQERIKSGDIILVKGSQGARMEKVVKEIMAEPLRAKELLVRQGKEWDDK